MAQAHLGQSACGDVTTSRLNHRIKTNKHDGPCFPPCPQAVTRSSSSDWVDTKTLSQLLPETFQDIPAKLSCIITLDYLGRLSRNVWTHSDPSEKKESHALASPAKVPRSQSLSLPFQEEEAGLEPK